MLNKDRVNNGDAQCIETVATLLNQVLVKTVPSKRKNSFQMKTNIDTRCVNRFLSTIL